MPYSPIASHEEDDFSHLPTVDGLVSAPAERVGDTQRTQPTWGQENSADLEAPAFSADHEAANDFNANVNESFPEAGKEIVIQSEQPGEDEQHQPALNQVMDASGEKAVVGVVEALDVEAPADNQEVIQHAKKRALIWAAGVHLAILLILALVQVAPMRQPVSEIVAVSAVEAQETPIWQKVAPPQPVANSGPSVQPLVATGMSSVVMPDVDFTPTATELNVGSSLGTFGGGSAGAGGAISFMGNQGRGNRVVFVVDVSGSMSATSQVGNATISRFELLKKELSKSLGQLRSGVQYQVLYFSDFAWPHDEVDSNNATAMENYRWDIRPGQKDARIPSYRYLTANSSSINRSRKIIEESSNPGGTNWGSGLLMALRGNPKPDLIFFMTDGNRSDALTWVDEVTEANSRGKRTVIHTTAMMEPGAARELDELARRNGGKFTVVMADGKVVKGADFLKAGSD